MSPDIFLMKRVTKITLDALNNYGDSNLSPMQIECKVLISEFYEMINKPIESLSTSEIMELNERTNKMVEKINLIRAVNANPN
jgi:hypothetical protein